MTDKLTKAARSENMRRIKSKSTTPEVRVRKIVTSMGFRYRLHRKDLPGKPDLVFSGKRKAIFVHGCFWHQHSQCREGRAPSSRLDYWQPKLRGNIDRDKRHQEALAELGWKILVVWECQIVDELATREIITKFLNE